MTVSAMEAREAEHEARRQRIGRAHLLRADEGKVTSAAGLMHLRRIMAAGRIAEHFEISKPTLSGHLAILRTAKLVTTERRGTTISTL